jgi:hypothetical protein
MEDITKWPERQTVAHYVFNDRGLTIVMKPMSVPPEAIRAVQLLVYELDGWLPA